MRMRFPTLISLLGLLLVGLGTVALAGKGGGKPGGGGGDPPPAPNPAIVYEQHDGTQWNVMVMNADGSNQAVLLPGHLPSWSPDGQKVAFRTGDADGPHGIYVVHVDGTGLTKIIPGGTFSGVFDLVWSPVAAPDGREKLAFSAGVDGSHLEIYVVNTDGTGLVDLTNDAYARDWCATWSPDATQLAIARRPIAAGAGLATEILIWDLGLDANDEIVITDETTLTGVPRLDGTNHIDAMDWARTKARLVISVYVVSANWTKLTIVDLTDTTQSIKLNTGSASEREPSWSPDDSKIVFRRDGFGKESKKTGLYAVNADGSGLTNLNAKEGHNPAWKR